MKLTLTIGTLLLWAPYVAMAQAPQIFNSPEAAAQALIQAASQNNTGQLATIFGPQGQRTLSSGSSVQDEAECRQFAQMAQAKHRLEFDQNNPNRAFLLVGSDEWPFPAPIVKTAGGWVFDPSLAAVEMKARRIGANELDAIEISSGFVTAQHQYASQPRDQHKIREYAQQIMSSPGQHDGLYWTGDSPPLVPRGLAEADLSGANPNPKPYHGYYFKVLKSQGADAMGGQHLYVVKDMMFGGFALVAWPAQYGVTGVHTFVVNQRGHVYEKDLGPKTTSLAPSMRTYNPDNSWTDVE
jgi:hypothetical protein